MFSDTNIAKQCQCPLAHTVNCCFLRHASEALLAFLCLSVCLSTGVYKACGGGRLEVRGGNTSGAALCQSWDGGWQMEPSLFASLLGQPGVGPVQGLRAPRWDQGPVALRLAHPFAHSLLASFLLHIPTSPPTGTSWHHLPHRPLLFHLCLKASSWGCPAEPDGQFLKPIHLCFLHLSFTDIPEGRERKSLPHSPDGKAEAQRICQSWSQLPPSSLG